MSPDEPGARALHMLVDPRPAPQGDRSLLPKPRPGSRWADVPGAGVSACPGPGSRRAAGNHRARGAGRPPPLVGSPARGAPARRHWAHDPTGTIARSTGAARMAGRAGRPSRGPGARAARDLRGVRPLGDGAVPRVRRAPGRAPDRDRERAGGGGAARPQRARLRRDRPRARPELEERGTRGSRAGDGRRRRPRGRAVGGSLRLAGPRRRGGGRPASTPRGPRPLGDRAPGARQARGGGPGRCRRAGDRAVAGGSPARRAGRPPPARRQRRHPAAHGRACSQGRAPGGPVGRTAAPQPLRASPGPGGRRRLGRAHRRRRGDHRRHAALLRSGTGGGRGPTARRPRPGGHAAPARNGAAPARPHPHGAAGRARRPASSAPGDRGAGALREGRRMV